MTCFYVMLAFLLSTAVIISFSYAVIKRVMQSTDAYIKFVEDNVPPRASYAPTRDNSSTFSKPSNPPRRR